MTFANPLVITLGGSGGTAKSLPKINQDAYGSEYYLRESAQEFRVKIRHTTETPAVGKAALDRHNVELTHITFGTAGAPDVMRQVYMVVRNERSDSASIVSQLGTALTYLFGTATPFTDLVGWVN